MRYGDAFINAALLPSVTAEGWPQSVSSQRETLAQAYAVLGNPTSALRMLQHSISGGFFCYPYFVYDPLLQSLRTDPEFGELLNQARIRHEQFKTTFF